MIATVAAHSRATVSDDVGAPRLAAPTSSAPSSPPATAMPGAEALEHGWAQTGVKRADAPDADQMSGAPQRAAIGTALPLLHALHEEPGRDARAPALAAPKTSEPSGPAATAAPTTAARQSRHPGGADLPAGRRRQRTVAPQHDRSRVSHMTQGPAQLAQALTAAIAASTPPAPAPVAPPTVRHLAPASPHGGRGADPDRDFDLLVDRLVAEMEFEFLRIYGTTETGR